MNTEHTSHILVKKCTFFLVTIIAIATVLRPLVAQQDPVFTYIGVVNSLLGVILYFYVIKSEPKVSLGYWFVVYCSITIIPLLLISGGVNSQFAVVLPVTPIIICLIINASAAWATFGFVVVLVAFMLSVESYLPNFAEEQLSQQKTYARAFWLVAASLLSTLFSKEFYRLSSTLSNKLQHQANIDSLTGLANRRSMLELLNDTYQRACAHRQRFTVMMLDVDFFKKVNDQYGHAIGDKALRHIADILKSSLRSNLDGVGRYGGEEFLIVLPNVDIKYAQQVAQKILLAIQNSPLNADDLTINLSATIGYCCADGQGLVSIEKILSNADQALYHGKALGRNRAECFVF